MPQSGIRESVGHLSEDDKMAGLDEKQEDEDHGLNDPARYRSSDPLCSIGKVPQLWVAHLKLPDHVASVDSESAHRENEDAAWHQTKRCNGIRKV